MVFCGGKYKGLSILAMIIFCSFCFSYLKPMDTYSISSTLTLSVIDKLGLNISSVNSEGVFATSDTNTNNISVSTSNGTGYMLGIKASTEGGNALVNEIDSSKTIPSHNIAAGVSMTDYNNASYASANSLNNTWGFRPSTYYDTANNITINNTSSNLYFPGPSSATNLFIIDKTTVSNATANEYNIALGTRINSDTAPGKYTDTFIITAVANPTVYSVTYNQNTTDTVTNMPTNVVNQETYGDSVNISSTVPERDGFNFKGWCTTQVADDDTCSGTTYNPDGEGTDLAWSLDQTIQSNLLTIYAMWEQAITMQSVTWEDLDALVPNTGDSIKLMDERDGQKYWVGRQADGNVWMTQNLDLDIGGAGVATLTSMNTDLNVSGVAPYVDGYSTSDGVVTWTPDITANSSSRVIASDNTIPDWIEDDNEPYSAEGGDRYYYTTGTTDDEIAQTLAECVAAGHTKEDCAHYHAGNYYNWSAAIASNDSSGISTEYDVAANSICPKGWKIPQGRTSVADDTVTRQFSNLWYMSQIITSFNRPLYATGGFDKIRTTPLYFVRGGYIWDETLAEVGKSGSYISSSVSNSDSCYRAFFNKSGPNIADSARGHGRSLRCLVR